MSCVHFRGLSISFFLVLFGRGKNCKFNQRGFVSSLATCSDVLSYPVGAVARFPDAKTTGHRVATCGLKKSLGGGSTM